MQKNILDALITTAFTVQYLIILDNFSTSGRDFSVLIRY